MHKIKELKNRMSVQMILSSMFMPINTVLSLIYTRFLLKFLGTNAYGTWITISSISQWILYFDLGIGNGMRNELAKEVSQRNKDSAKRISSTAYFVISIIALIAMIVFIILALLIDIDSFFNNGISVKPVIIITTIFVCLNFVLSLCKSQLFAQQKAELVGLMNVLVHVLQLIGILVATMLFKENIIVVAIISGLSSMIVNIMFSIALWVKTEYCKPELKFIDIKYLKKVGNLGIRFFILQMGCLVMYSTDNLIITRIFGPSEVTAYNTVYKVFNLILVAFSAFISPVWSKITIESAKKNYEYIKKIIKKLCLLLIPIYVGILILIAIFPTLSYWWLGETLYYEKGLILSMGIFIALNIFSSIFSSVLNGMGEINIQLIVSVFVAVLNIPLSIYLAKIDSLGVTGVIIASNVCMVISTLTVFIQTYFVIKKRIKIKENENSNI